MPKAPPFSYWEWTLLHTLQTSDADFVVTGVKALQLCLYEAGMEIPALFSPQGYPGMEVALNPNTYKTGLDALRDKVQDHEEIEMVSPSIDGQTADVIRVRGDGSDNDRYMQVSYDQAELDSYPNNPPGSRKITIGDLDVPVASLDAIYQTLYTKFENMAGDSSHKDLLLLELGPLVEALDTAHQSAQPSSSPYGNSTGTSQGFKPPGAPPTPPDQGNPPSPQH